MVRKIRNWTSGGVLIESPFRIYRFESNPSGSSQTVTIPVTKSNNFDSNWWGNISVPLTSSLMWIVCLKYRIGDGFLFVRVWKHLINLSNLILIIYEKGNGGSSDFCSINPVQLIEFTQGDVAEFLFACDRVNWAFRRHPIIKEAASLILPAALDSKPMWIATQKSSSLITTVGAFTIVPSSKGNSRILFFEPPDSSQIKSKTCPSAIERLVGNFQSRMDAHFKSLVDLGVDRIQLFVALRILKWIPASSPSPHTARQCIYFPDESSGSWYLNEGLQDISPIVSMGLGEKESEASYSEQLQLLLTPTCPPSPQLYRIKKNASLHARLLSLFFKLLFRMVSIVDLKRNMTNRSN